ncbi:hypothetical protein GCM10010302_74400 [Streptomyces polychromogenes]|uniref:Uncharacterized protein n=1 Tax=Streptomyces polychromogenes TaxID=67342 RepID=A0ABN0W3T6_9ACTN
MTTPPTYHTGRWTGPLPTCPHCGAEPLPLGGPEGGAVVHSPSCSRRLPTPRQENPMGKHAGPPDDKPWTPPPTGGSPDGSRPSPQPSSPPPPPPGKK